MDLQKPRGTRDFLPDEMRFRRWAEARMRRTAESYGYEEVQTPTFETLELFVRKSGPGIVNEVYDFKDKGDRTMALRPELTAPVVRMVFENMQAAPRPMRLYYIGNCFRYDRPQKGRYREFFQFGAEILGATGPMVDAEIIDLACSCLDAIGLKGYELKVGSIGVIRSLLSAWGLSPEGQTSVLQALDKLEAGELRTELEKYLDDPKIETLESLTGSGGDLAVLRNLLAGNAEALAALDSLAAVCDSLRALGREPALDPAVVRGLDYYTGMVFEVEVASLGAEKQVCGGGAYALGEIIGGQSLPGCGFGIGFDRVLLTVDRREEARSWCVAVIPMGEKAEREAPAIARMLRGEGLRAVVSVGGRSLGKAMKYANAMKADFAVIVGDDELAKGVVALKDLAKGTQSEVPPGDLAKTIKGGF